MSFKNNNHNKFKDRFLFSALIFLLIVVTGCSSAEKSYTVNEEPIPTMGNYLTDKAAITLYYNTGDSLGKSNVNGDDLDDWPIFYTSAIVIPSTLKRSDFGSIKRPDGALQTTYKGWPLYYCDKDDEPGDMVGQGVGGVWFLASPNIPKAPDTPGKPDD